MYMHFYFLETIIMIEMTFYTKGLIFSLCSRITVRVCYHTMNLQLHQILKLWWHFSRLFPRIFLSQIRYCYLVLCCCINLQFQTSISEMLQYNLKLVRIYLSFRCLRACLPACMMTAYLPTYTSGDPLAWSSACLVVMTFTWLKETLGRFWGPSTIWQVGRQAYRQGERQANRQTNRQAGRYGDACGIHWQRWAAS